MNKRIRYEMLSMLVKLYACDKKRSQTEQNERDVSYMHSLGLLQGACMAFECDMTEEKQRILIYTRKLKRQILEYQIGPNEGGQDELGK